MPLIHHTAICTSDLEASLRFWREGLGFETTMEGTFEGDWKTLLGADTTSLRSVFLGDPAIAQAGIIELVDFGDTRTATVPAASAGFLLVSLFTDVTATLRRLHEAGFGHDAATIESYGVTMATVRDPNGTLVELIDQSAEANLDSLSS